MALQKSIVKKFYGKDVTFESAYIKVEKVVITSTEAFAEVVTYTHQGGQQLDKDFIRLEPSLEVAGSFMSQVYQIIKTMDDYTDAVDV